jgi:hypothetical protein
MGFQDLQLGIPHDQTGRQGMTQHHDGCPFPAGEFIIHLDPINFNVHDLRSPSCIGMALYNGYMDIRNGMEVSSRRIVQARQIMFGKFSLRRLFLGSKSQIRSSINGNSSQKRD